MDHEFGEEHAVVRSLSGVVKDGSGSPIHFVLVERMSSDFKLRIQATLTDEKGTFRFRHADAGNHYLRFRFRGFNDYEIPVIISPKAKKTRSDNRNVGEQLKLKLS